MNRSPYDILLLDREREVSLSPLPQSPGQPLVRERINPILRSTKKSSFAANARSLVLAGSSSSLRFNRPTVAVNSALPSSVMMAHPLRPHSLAPRINRSDSSEAGQPQKDISSDPPVFSPLNFQQIYKSFLDREDEDEDDLTVSSTSSDGEHDSGDFPFDLPSIPNMKQWLLVPLILVLLSTKTSFLWKSQWHRLSNRTLRGRQCVMNLFVDKQSQNEFNPDRSSETKHFSEHKIENTYRTKGQFEVITRLIASVADSFRSNLKVEQHIVFAGTRDGGHLAQDALIHWPARGLHATQLHIIAADENESSDARRYGTLEKLEKRFEGASERVHLYDALGNAVGIKDEQDDDFEDDDDDTTDLLQPQDGRRRRLQSTNNELPPLSKTLFPYEDDLKDVIIPYMHVDGVSMEQQLAILDKGRPLLADHSIVVVGIEHSPDLDVSTLVDYFDNLNYKTFMLGLRQLTRIDNLCPEVMDNVLKHPSISTQSIFGDPNVRQTPPFFVAMPKGRRSQQEMTIQHMYDLFSGLGGGGQVKTANDRKAPEPKKKAK